MDDRDFWDSYSQEITHAETHTGSEQLLGVSSGLLERFQPRQDVNDNKHTNYQLWESPCKGFLSTYLNDFIILNKDGMSFVKLSEHEMRKAINNEDGIKRMIHSIGSANYLKIEDGNMVDYESPMGNETSHNVTI